MAEELKVGRWLLFEKMSWCSTMLTRGLALSSHVGTCKMCNTQIRSADQMLGAQGRDKMQQQSLARQSKSGVNQVAKQTTPEPSVTYTWLMHVPEK